MVIAELKYSSVRAQDPNRAPVCLLARTNEGGEENFFFFGWGSERIEMGLGEQWEIDECLEVKHSKVKGEVFFPFFNPSFLILGGRNAIVA